MYQSILEPPLCRAVLERVMFRAAPLVEGDIRLASELEFYVAGTAPVDDISGEIIQHLFSYLKGQGVPFTKVERERGHGQFEVALQHTDPMTAADWSEATRRAVGAALAEICLEADFTSKPLAEDFGSGLHVHASLHRPDGSNLFHKTGGEYSPWLRHALGGLLDTMKDALLLAAPLPEDYRRFHAGFDAPTCICWGGNNRTVAVRLPDSAADNKHLEYRMAGANADTYLVMAAVIAGIAHGIEHGLEPPGQIFGNAYLAMYNLEPIPKDYAVAVEAFRTSRWVADWFGEEFQAAYLSALGVAA